MIKNIITLLLALPVWTAMAQLPCRLEIRGVILDATDSARLPNVEVFIEKGHLRSFSDPKGNFILKTVCPGPQIIEFEKAGFDHMHAEIDLSKDTLLYIWMFPKSTLTDTIRLSTLYSDGKSFSDDSRKAEIKVGNNLAEALSNVPGVSLMQGGKNQAKPILRGMYGLRLPIITGNFRLEGQQWGNDHNPEADPNSFEKINIVRDAEALVHSHDGHFGIISLTNIPDVHEGESSLDQSVSYGSNGNQMAYKSKFIRQTDAHSPIVHATASVRKAGNYQIPGLIIDNTGVEELAISGGIKQTKEKTLRIFTGSAYRFEGGIFTGARAGNVNDLLTAIQRKTPLSSDNFSFRIGAPRQVSGHVDLQYQNIKTLDNRNRLWSVGLQFDQRREFDFHRNSQWRFPQLDLYLLVPSFKYEVKRRVNKNKSLGWGSALSFYNHRYGGYYFLPDFTGITGGTYVEMAAQIRQTHISFALRGDAKGLRSEVREAGFVQTVQRQFINYSSALTIKKKIKNRYADRSTLLTLNASRTWRAPWLNELYSSGVHHGAASFEKGNINLRPEVCYRIEGIADVSHKKWQAFLSPYLAYLPGFINLAPMSSPVVTVRGVFPGFEYIQGDLIMCGFDAGLNIDLFKHLKWRGDINYIYQKYTNSKRYPAFIPPARIKQQLEFNNSRFSGSVSFDYTFKQNLYTNGTDYLPPPNAFALWGLRIFRKYLNTSFGLEVNNALNTTYRSYMDRFRYFMPMPGRNITFTFQHQIHHHTKKHSKTQ